MSILFGRYGLSSPVGVLVMAALPWAPGITEVDLDVGGHRESLVTVYCLRIGERLMPEPRSCP